MKKSILALGAAVLLFAACKKDDEPSRRDHLTTGQWRINQFTTATSAFGQSSEMDAYASMEACEKDNLLSFMTDATLKSDDGPTKCASADPQTEIVGAWSLNTSDTKLLMTYSAGTAFSSNFTIDELTGSALRIHFDTTISQLGITAVVSVKMGFTKN